MASSEAALAVAAKHQDLVTKHKSSIDKVEELHNVAVDDLLPAALQEMQLEQDPHAETRARAFLDDRGRYGSMPSLAEDADKLRFENCLIFSNAVSLLPPRTIHSRGCTLFAHRDTQLASSYRSRLSVPFIAAPSLYLATQSAAFVLVQHPMCR